MVQPTAEKTAGVLGAAFLLGAPLVLVHIGWPLETGEPEWAVVLMHLRAFTLPTPLVLAGLVGVVGAAWAVYALAAAADLVRVVRGQTPRLAVARMAAALLAATATGSVTASPALADSGATPAPAAASNTAHAESAGEGKPHEAIDRHRAIAGFAFDSAELDAGMRASLDSVAELIRAYGDAEQPVVITGHTDPTGSDAYNLRLSQRRAEAAADYLRAALGAEFSFTVEGAGSAQPRAEGAVSYADLRRVEIDYRLQPPPAPAPATPAEEASGAPADHDKNAPAAQEREGEESGSGIAQAASTAAVGTAVLAGGYVLARRSRRGRSETRQPAHEKPEADAASSELAAEATEPRADAPADAVVTSPATAVRLGPTLTVDGARGLAITGPGAAGIVTALLDRVAREAPGSVIATRPALAQIGCTDEGDLPGVTRTGGIEAALVRAEAYLVAAQRTAEEDTGEAAAGLPTVLLQGPGEGTTRERVRAMLAAETTTTPIVIALADLGQGTRVDADDERLHITEDDGTVREVPADAAWSQMLSAGEEPPPAVKLPGPLSEPAAYPDPSAQAPPQQPGTEQAPVVLRLFAPRLSVEVGGTAVGEGMRAAARLLLAYLAINPDGATGEEIGELLAPNASPPRARSARNNALSSARSAIRTALGTEDTPVIEAIDGRYRLQKELFDVDLWQFNSALARTRTSSGDACAHNRRTGLGHYVGELLSDISDAWVEAERHRCRRSAAQTCVRLAEDADAVEEKVSWLERACTIDSYNEMVHRMLIEAHAENSDSDAAHRTYERLRENLRGIGERPSKELRALVERHTSVPPLRVGAPR